MKFPIIVTILSSLLIGGACEEIDFHSGSIKEMDALIQKCEEGTPTIGQKEKRERTTKSVNSNAIKDIMVVQRLVDVYPTPEGTKRKIVSSVLRYAKEFNIDPVTLTAVLAKESSLNPGAKHAPVYVKVPTKKNWVSYKSAHVTAVGLGGVIFEIWKYELAEIGIKKRQDLFSVEGNIKAAALILSIYTHERKQLKHTASKEESALLRYYGVMRDKRGKPIKTYSTQVYKIEKMVRNG